MSASPLLAPTSSHLGVREPGVVERLETVELGASSFNKPSMLLWVFMLGCWARFIQGFSANWFFYPMQSTIYILHISFCIYLTTCLLHHLNEKCHQDLKRVFHFWVELQANCHHQPPQSQNSLKILAAPLRWSLLRCK